MIRKAALFRFCSFLPPPHSPRWKPARSQACAGPCRCARAIAAVTSPIPVPDNQIRLATNATAVRFAAAARGALSC